MPMNALKVFRAWFAVLAFAWLLLALSGDSLLRWITFGTFLAAAALFHLMIANRRVQNITHGQDPEA